MQNSDFNVTCCLGVPKATGTVHFEKIKEFFENRKLNGSNVAQLILLKIEKANVSLNTDLEKIHVKYFNNEAPPELETLKPVLIKTDGTLNWIEQDGNKFVERNCSQNPHVRGMVGALFQKKKISTISLEFKGKQTFTVNWMHTPIKIAQRKTAERADMNQKILDQFEENSNMLLVLMNRSDLIISSANSGIKPTKKQSEKQTLQLLQEQKILITQVSEMYLGRGQQTDMFQEQFDTSQEQELFYGNQNSNKRQKTEN